MKHHLLSNETILKLAGSRRGRIAVHIIATLERPRYAPLAVAGIRREINLYWLYVAAFVVASVLK